LLFTLQCARARARCHLVYFSAPTDECAKKNGERGGKTDSSVRFIDKSRRARLPHATRSALRAHVRRRSRDPSHSHVRPHRRPPAPFTDTNSENFHPCRFIPSSSASTDGARRPVMYAAERTAEGADWSGNGGRRTSSGCNFREKGQAGRSRTGVIDGSVGVSPITRSNYLFPRLLRGQCGL
jgi:hypothetical protein